MVPDGIPATHESNGKPLFERPLCAFPKVAQWDGKSDPAKASSFRCVEISLNSAGSAVCKAVTLRKSANRIFAYNLLSQSTKPGEMGLSC